MLVFTRKQGESFWIDQNVRVTVTKCNRSNVRIAVDCPRDVTVLREEIFLRILGEEDESDDVGA